MPPGPYAATGTLVLTVPSEYNDKPLIPRRNRRLWANPVSVS